MAKSIISAADAALRRIALLLLFGYQKLLSPLLGGACRFTPSCSEYAKIVFQTRSTPAALWLTVCRLLRCHPFCDGGEDWPPHSQNKTSATNQTPPQSQAQLQPQLQNNSEVNSEFNSTANSELNSATSSEVKSELSTPAKNQPPPQ